MKSLAPVSVVVMTYNEELNVEACLQSVAGWADEIFVVDSFSTDRTEAIARIYTENFVQHAYESHPAQWNWALNNLDFRNEWVFAMDADMRATEPLKQALKSILANAKPEVAGMYVRHKEIWRDRFIRHGTIYPRYWLRLFRPETVFVDENDLVDLHFYVRGTSIKVEYDLIEHNAKESSLDFWVSKQLRFAKRAAVEEIKRRKTAELAPVKPTLFGTPDQRTLWLKSRWYYLPLYWRSVAYFLYRYFLRLGFLDGREGFLFHFSQALIYRIMVDARIEELEKEEKSLEQISQQATPLGPQQTS